MPYILPLGARTPPVHLAVSDDTVIVTTVSVTVSIINTLLLLYGIQYIFPLGARTPPNHLATPVNPDIVVVFVVLVIGLIINTLVLVNAIP